MRAFNTVVLERLRTFEGDFETEPYETAWASEAMFFVRIHEISGAGAALQARVQVSVEGIEWIDEGTSFAPKSEPGNSFVKVTHFGGWLRLACRVGGSDPRVKLTIALALKE